MAQVEGEETSSIHFMEVEQIHQKFAPRYQLKHFKSIYKRLVDHLKGNTGPFAELQQNEPEIEVLEVEKWWTLGCISKGYSLLYNLYMEPEGTGIVDMPVRTLWQSRAAFRCYDLKMFEEYNQKMIRLTNKHRKVVMQDDAAFEHDKKLFPGNPVTVNGEPVWYTHPAKELLKRDVKNGLASSLKPSELRDTRPEYKEFSVKKFCKQVHHEKQRQRAKPFWQWFRNKDAREMHERQVAELRKEWINNNDEDVIDLAETLNNKKFF